MDLQKRKLQRLKEYDYTQNGAYFITICTNNHVSLFGEIENGRLILNHAVKMIFGKFLEIPKFYSDISIDKLIVMPNHLHAILLIQYMRTERSGSGTAQGPFPTMGLSDYVHRFKTLTTKLYIDGVKNGSYTPFNKKFWQKSYHDHIIKNEREYQEIWEYIENNPLRWQEDKYFV